MITMNGIRNGIWFAVAFGIVACASTPMPVEKLAIAKTSLERAEQAQAAQFAQVELASARNKYAPPRPRSTSTTRKSQRDSLIRRTSMRSSRNRRRAPSSRNNW